MSWQQPKCSYTLWISCKGKVNFSSCLYSPITPWFSQWKNGELVSPVKFVNLNNEAIWRNSSHKYKWQDLTASQECCGTFPNVRTARASGLCWMSIPVVWTCQMMRSVGKHVQNNKIMLDLYKISSLRYLLQKQQHLWFFSLNSIELHWTVTWS